MAMIFNYVKKSLASQITKNHLFFMLCTVILLWLCSSSMNNFSYSLNINSRNAGMQNSIPSSADAKENQSPKNFDTVYDRNCTKNSTENIRLYKHLVHPSKQDGVHLDDSAIQCYNSTVNKLQSSPKFLELKERLETARSGCRALYPRSAGYGRPDMLTDSEHRVSFCRNAKAGTTTLLRYFFKLNNHPGTLSLSTDQIHDAAKQYFSRSKPGIGAKNEKDNLRIVLVRHPFHRTVSAYYNKVIQTDYYARRKLYKAMKKFSHLSDSEVHKMYDAHQKLLSLRSVPIRRFPCTLKKPAPPVRPDVENSGVPSLKQFVLAIVFEILDCHSDNHCLSMVDVHHRGLVSRCSACNDQFDAILKVESLEEDMKFLEDLLQLPPAWDCLQNTLRDTSFGSPKVEEKRDWGGLNCTVENGIPSPEISLNRAHKPLSYSQYMNQLGDFEKQLLYNAYYEDFQVFGYDPCEGL